MEFYDKILLRKRAVIESVNDFLKNICQIEHFGHRSCCNFVVNLVSSTPSEQFLEFTFPPNIDILYEKKYLGDVDNGTLCGDFNRQ